MFGWLFIGAAVGWLIGMLLDWFWWRDRRYCSEDELKLRKEVEELEGRVAAFDKERADWEKKQARVSAPVAKAPKRAAAAGLAGAGVAGVAAATAMPSRDKVEAKAEAKAEVVAADVEKDDLQKLWGIGPASEAVLNKNGIYTYAQLCKADPADLRKMLDESDGTFNMVREDTWPEQACMADKGEWVPLDAKQEEITSEYVASEFTGEYTGKKDKLTKLWGIGPAVERVLHSKGVFRFDQLAGMPLPMLQGIITAAGSRFSLVKPELWIPQAEVAATGDMDALETLKKKISKEQGKK